MKKELRLGLCEDRRNSNTSSPQLVRPELPRAAAPRVEAKASSMHSLYFKIIVRTEK